MKNTLVNNVRSVKSLYSAWLLELGGGKLGNQFSSCGDIIEIPDNLICTGSFVNEIFGSII